ncbi:molecular chaperone HtpG [Pancytospora philotis]|nr:molecular chaperone HtpG [Pancytospora philotis]
MESVENKKEMYDFEAEVPQVMSIIINSMYSKKELFIRELVSNASDALAKMMSSKDALDKAGYSTTPMCNYRIQVIVDKENRTVTVRDNGIGMTKAELKAFLGRIASSGTKKFREAVEKSEGESNLEALIGQFGLGFYSAFLVADHVDVLTKSCQDEGYMWSSEGVSSYTIVPHAFDGPHGTAVVLRLKEGEDEYLQTSRLTSLLEEYSKYVRFSLTLVTEEDVTEEAAKEEKEIEGDEVVELKDEATENENENAEANKAEAASQPRKKIVEKKINSEVPSWTRTKLEDIPEESLKKLYKELSQDYDDYLAVQSWHFEGIMDLKILLFIPKRPRMSFFEQNKSQKSTNIQVHNSNVPVMKELDLDVVPEWMQFVVGIVSSADFPMNVSREFLQGKSALNLIRSRLPKCIAEMIGKLEADEEKYKKFYENFSTNIKLAVRQYTGAQQESFARFLRYPTNQDKTKLVSLDAYREALPESAKQILVLTGQSKVEVESSIYLEGYAERPVLLMSEAIDEIMLQSFKTYKEMAIQLISVEGVESLNAESEEACAALAAFIKDEYKDKLENVVVASKTESVAAILYSSKYAGTGTMENIIRSHANVNNNPMLMMMMHSKKILEINAASPVIAALRALHEAGNLDEVRKHLPLIYESALIGCGYILDDKAAYVKNVYAMLAGKLAQSN